MIPEKPRVLVKAGKAVCNRRPGRCGVPVQGAYGNNFLVRLTCFPCSSDRSFRQCNPDTAGKLHHGKQRVHAISTTPYLPVWHDRNTSPAVFSVPFQNHTASDFKVMTVVMTMPSTQTDSGIQKDPMNCPV